MFICSTTNTCLEPINSSLLTDPNQDVTCEILIAFFTSIYQTEEILCVFLWEAF